MPSEHFCIFAQGCKVWLPSRDRRGVFGSIGWPYGSGGTGFESIVSRERPVASMLYARIIFDEDFGMLGVGACKGLEVIVGLQVLFSCGRRRPSHRAIERRNSMPIRCTRDDLLIKDCQVCGFRIGCDVDQGETEIAPFRCSRAFFTNETPNDRPWISTSKRNMIYEEKNEVDAPSRDENAATLEVS